MNLSPAPGRWPVPRTLAAGLALLLAMTAASLWFQHQAGRAAALQQHSYEVRLQLDALRADVLEISRGVRGYMASGQADWLAPFTHALHRAPERLHSLQALTADNPLQQARLRQFQQQLDTLAAQDEALVRQGMTQGVEAGRQALARADAAAQVATLKALLDVLEAEELQLQARRDAAEQRSTRVALAVWLAGSVLGFALLAWAGGALQRNLRRLHASVAALRQAQDSLGGAHERLRQQATQLAELNEALWRSVGDGRNAPAAPPAPARLDAPERLAALRRTALMDSPPEESFDRFTRLAAASLQAPMSLISLVDDRRQFFKSAHGLPEPLASRRETPLSASFCRHVVTAGAPLVVEDALRAPPSAHGDDAVLAGVVAYLGVPLATPDGHVLGSFCVLDDRPRQWSAEDRSTMERIGQSVLAAIAVRMQLRELERRVAERTAEVRLLAGAIQNSLNGFSIVDREGRITFVNEALVRMAGYTSPHEVIGTHVAEHCVDPALPARLTAELRTRGACRIEFAGRRRDGGTFEVLLDAHRAHDEGGAEIYVGSAVDITERKQAEQALRASLAEKEALLQEVHHRVKNNLQVVCSLLQLQRRQLGDPAAEAVFAETEQRVHAMALVHQRLYQQHNLSALDFAGYLRGLGAQLVQSFAGGRTVRVAWQLETLQVPLAAAIPLGLIATELLTNAMKYARTPQGTVQLAVTLEPEGAQGLRLTVSDDGPGLPEGLDPARCTSLGLRLVQMLSRQIGATVAFDAPPGGGTRCRVEMAEREEEVAVG